MQHIVHGMQRHDIQFGLVGGGTELPAMRKLAEELGVADYVTFTGRVPDDELLAMLNTADVCVNPDVANDMNDKSTMNKIMEYMALGKPIVQFDLTEGRVSAQDASLYAQRNDPIDMARKLVALLDDAPLRARMGAAGLRAGEDRAGLGARGAAAARGLRQAVQRGRHGCRYGSGIDMRYVALAARFRRNAGARRPLRRALHRSAARAGRDRPQADPGDRA